MVFDTLILAIWDDYCWLPLLLAAILPFILGWLLGGIGKGEMRRTMEEQAAEIKEQKARLTAMEKAEKETNYKLERCETEKKELRSSFQMMDMERLALKERVAELEGGDGDTTNKVADTGKTAMGAVAAAGINYSSLFQSDNLQVVEGIGPKVEKLLKDNGINTWAELAAQSPDNLNAILVGAKLNMLKADSWPRQAELAAAGKWDELVEYQKFLDGGKETAGDFNNPAKIEKMGIKLLGFTQDPEDLKIVEGIGPKIEGLLKDAGINTWNDLAAAEVSKIQEILDVAGSRYKLANPSTWPQQAGLAAAGKWDELAELQEYLQGGKDPV